jgi:YcaO-like protein with predicted kinase domain
MLSTEAQRRTTPPLQTIERIQNILNELGFLVQERHWESEFNHIYCVELWSQNFPGVGSGGKGVTRELARASAYAELLERLQSGIALPECFGLSGVRLYPKSLNQSALQTASNLPQDFREHILEPGQFPKTASFHCVEYVRLSDGKSCFLPQEVINIVCDSNGIASGNTNDEALCHAAFELIERFAIQTIFDEGRSLPRIEMEGVKELHAYFIVQEIQQQGFKVQVLDASLGGRLPVVAVLISHKQGIRYAFGADLSLDICLQRCLTEAFQGILDEDAFVPHCYENAYLGPEFCSNPFEKSTLRSRFIGRNTPTIFGSFLIGQGISCHEQVFEEAIEAPELTWLKLKALLQAEFGEIYIQDLSRLNFPCWRVFAPTASPIHRDDRSLYPSIQCEFESMKGPLLNLAEISAKTAKELAKRLESYFRDSPEVLYDHPNAYLSLTGIRVIPDAETTKWSLFFLMGHLYLAAGELDRASFYFWLSISDRGGLKHPSHQTELRCVILFLQGLDAKNSVADLKNQLKDYFDWTLVQKVVTLYSNHGLAYRQRYFPCWSNADGCPPELEVMYEKYRKLSENIENYLNNAMEQEEQ